VYSFFNLGARCGWVVSVTPQPLHTRETDPSHLHRRLGGPQGQYGLVRKSSPPPPRAPGFFQPDVFYSYTFCLFRSPDRPAHSMCLHRLHYNDPHFHPTPSYPILSYPILSYVMLLYLPLSFLSRCIFLYPLIFTYFRSSCAILVCCAFLPLSCDFLFYTICI
jgi:hypothetical protein